MYNFLGNVISELYELATEQRYVEDIQYDKNTEYVNTKSHTLECLRENLSIEFQFIAQEKNIENVNKSITQIIEEKIEKSDHFKPCRLMVYYTNVQIDLNKIVYKC